MYSVWKLHRKESYAVIVDDQMKTKKLLKLNLKHNTFSWDDGRYNIGGEPITYGKKKLYLYRVNRADPINILDKEHSRMDADTYEAVFRNKLIQDINRGVGLFGLDKKQMIMIGLAVIAGFILLNYVR